MEMYIWSATSGLQLGSAIDTVSVTNTLDSTSTDTGALQVDGGVGIAKSQCIGNNLTIGYMSSTYSAFAQWANVSSPNVGKLRTLWFTYGQNSATGDLYDTINDSNNTFFWWSPYNTNKPTWVGSSGGGYRFTGDVRTGGNLYVEGGLMAPAVDNVTYLGNLSTRWVGVYAVNGTIQTSDANLKEDVQPLSVGLDFVKKLKPVEYKMKSPSKATAEQLKAIKHYVENKHMGLTGQNVLSALKDSPLENSFAGIEKTSDGTLMMNYAHFIAPLIKAVQELEQKHEEIVRKYESSVSFFNSRIQDLEERLHAMRKSVRGSRHVPDTFVMHQCERVLPAGSQSLTPTRSNSSSSSSAYNAYSPS